MIGTTLAHYEVLAALGRGGMGEVWKARDTKLGREVAIKTLPEAFAADLDRLARFEREAKLLASLNHPHIGAIYGLEESGGTRFIVLELVEGPTLAERLASDQGSGIRDRGSGIRDQGSGIRDRGSGVPVDEALAIARQIADAIEAAHEQGIIHRDLKPANVKVREDGTVKVLDFGLAKALEGDRPTASLSQSPTISVAATRQGFILGTAAYMAPEQARGRTVDRRADIWAFGCVLFELLAGRPAFPGDDVSDVLASVLKSEPGWNSLPARLHPRLREILRRCLEKDPQRRYRDIGDVKMDIDGLLADPARLAAPEHGTAVVTRPSRVAWAAGVVLAVVSGAAAWYVKPAPAPAPRPVTRFVHDVPAGVDVELLNPAIALSPAGDQFVYAAADGLYLRRLNELEARRIPGTEQEGPVDPFFSPDGEWIGYLSLRASQLKKIPVRGGEPVFLAEVTGSVFGPSWTASGWILYVQQPRVMQVSANGGEPTVLVEDEELVVTPELLPDGDSLLFGRGNTRGIVVRSVTSGEETLLFDDGDSGAAFLPSGHIVYGSGGDVFVRAFDLKTRAVGSRVPLVQSFYRASAESAPQFKVSKSGTLVYIPALPGSPGSTASRSASLVLLDRTGKADVLPAPMSWFRSPRFSPDDSRVAVEIFSSGGSNVWIYEIETNLLNQLTFDGGAAPRWSPDGKQIAFLRGDALWTVPSDFSGTPSMLPGTKVAGNRGPGAWSPDGGVLLFTSSAGIHAWTRNSTAEPAPVILPAPREGTLVGSVEFSPDGRWFVYALEAGDSTDLYVSPYPVASSALQRRITTDGAIWPVWVRRQPEIVFVSDTPQQSGSGGRSVSFFALPISTEPTLTRRNPAALFRFDWLRVLEQDGYDVSRDGRHILVPILDDGRDASASNSEPLRIHVVVNWLEEIRGRVPAP